MDACPCNGCRPGTRRIPGRCIVGAALPSLAVWEELTPFFSSFRITQNLILVEGVAYFQGIDAPKAHKQCMQSMLNIARGFRHNPVEGPLQGLPDSIPPAPLVPFPAFPENMNCPTCAANYRNCSSRPCIFKEAVPADAVGRANLILRVLDFGTVANILARAAVHGAAEDRAVLLHRSLHCLHYVATQLCTPPFLIEPAPAAVEELPVAEDGEAVEGLAAAAAVGELPVAEDGEAVEELSVAEDGEAVEGFAAAAEHGEGGDGLDGLALGEELRRLFHEARVLDHYKRYGWPYIPKGRRAPSRRRGAPAQGGVAGALAADQGRLRDIPQHIPRTMAEVFADFKPKREGLIKALTKDFANFYQLCDPEKENLCLYAGCGSWDVDLPLEEVPPEIPEPALGINFTRDEKQEDWLSKVAAHCDSWLVAVAFYFGARRGLGKNDREKLFLRINELPTISEVVKGNDKPKDQSGTYNGGKNKSSGKMQSRQPEPFTKPLKISPPKEEEEEEDDDEQRCGVCGDNNATTDGFWICCDVCDKWSHGKCVKITPAMAEHIEHYKCPACSTKKDTKKARG